jgi:hypothetical protein
MQEQYYRWSLNVVVRLTAVPTENCIRCLRDTAVEKIVVSSPTSARIPMMPWTTLEARRSVLKRHHHQLLAETCIGSLFS